MSIEPSHSASSKTNKGFFYWGLIMLVVALIGFWPSYFRPLFQHTFNSPVSLTHWHAAFTFLWLLLLVVQPLLVTLRKIKWHRMLGGLGLLTAIGVIYTGFMLQVQFMQHYFNLHELIHAVQVPFFRLMTLLVFTVCIVLAMAIKDRSWHKRLLFLGTFAILEAAFARFFLNYFGMLELSGLLGAVTHVGIMVYFVMWDRLRLGRFHPVTLWGAILITLVTFGTAPIADSGWWLEITRILADMAN